LGICRLGSCNQCKLHQFGSWKLGNWYLRRCRFWLPFADQHMNPSWSRKPHGNKFSSKSFVSRFHSESRVRICDLAHEAWWGHYISFIILSFTIIFAVMPFWFIMWILDHNPSSFVNGWLTPITEAVIANHDQWLWMWITWYFKAYIRTVVILHVERVRCLNPLSGYNCSSNWNRKCS
jgi:hypothetical protein